VKLQRVVVVDLEKRDVEEKTGGNRPDRIIGSLGPECVANAIPQVYGGPSLSDAPPEFNEELTRKTELTLNGAALVILHCSERQHLVPAVLRTAALRDIPCLLYTAQPGPPRDVVEYLRDDDASPQHVAIPVRLYPQLVEGWPQSRDGLALRECVKAALSGVPLKDAVRSAFGDPELDRILDDLYRQLRQLCDTQPLEGAGKRDFTAIQADRNKRLEAHYLTKRGWRDPALISKDGGA
jgi:hypothetical protein